MRVANEISNLSLSWWNYIFCDTILHNSWFTKDLEFMGKNNLVCQNLDNTEEQTDLKQDKIRFKVSKL